MQMIGKQSLLNEVSLYFHIPFCKRKCDYCHFYVIPEQESSKSQLQHALKLEWERWLPVLQHKQIATIYFGGGTPSLFGPERIQELLQLVRQSVSFSSLNPEITLEANPEDIEYSRMQEYVQAGINRVSIGIQSLDDSLLQLLGRLHGAKKAIESVLTTYKAGISNISIDLMYDLPKQTLEHWTHTLKAIRQLPVTHLSLYNLTIEPHTLFFKKQEALRSWLPNEETSLAMYHQAIEQLEQMGLQQYEISAFAKPNYHAQHNIGYWTARPFLGFGPSAFSYWEEKRFRNVANLNRYCQALAQDSSPIDFEEQLDLEARRRELLVIQLRLRCGVCIKAFQEQHGSLDQTTYQKLQELLHIGFLQQVDNQLSLTHRGILFYDTVASELI
jgi:oxygen-independent coproporphyrinogen-3 oxidase